MIRRTFKLPDDRELMVTYDPDTDTLNVGHRAASYDEWSRPLDVIETQDDDEQGRVGGIGMRRAGSVVPLDEVIEMMRQTVAAYDADQAATLPVEEPDVATVDVDESGADTFTVE